MSDATAATTKAAAIEKGNNTYILFVNLKIKVILPFKNGFQTEPTNSHLLQLNFVSHNSLK